MLPIALWSTRPQTLAALAIRFCAGDLCVLCNRHWRGRALVACDRPSQCPRAWSSSPFVPKQHATTADPCVKSWRYFDKNTKRAGRRNLLPPRDPPRFYRLLLGPLCLPSFAVCRSLASHSPVRRSKSSKSSCGARNASTSCGVGLLTICHKAADPWPAFRRRRYDKRHLKRQLGVLVSCPPRPGVTQYGELWSGLGARGFLGQRGESILLVNAHSSRHCCPRGPQGAVHGGCGDGTANAISGRDVRGPCGAPLARSLSRTRANSPRAQVSPRPAHSL